MSDPTQPPTEPDEPTFPPPFAGDPVPIEFDPEPDDDIGANDWFSYDVTVGDYSEDGDVFIEVYEGDTGAGDTSRSFAGAAAAGSASARDDSDRFFSQFTGKIRFPKNE